MGAALPAQARGDLDRRSFLRRSGLVAGSLAAVGTLSVATVRKAQAGPQPPPGAAVTVHRNVCTHCSVGCTVIAHVANGVWIEQEPAWDSPINRGSHCAKGAAVRDDVSSERRLRYPVKLVDGAWQRISWDQAIEEIGTKLLEIRAKSGPDSVYWLGSAKFTNEAAYLNRKFAAYWGTNNSDHQARICHSTTVAGVANTWGYGAMTNSYNDIRNAKTLVIMGGNPAEAHPVSLQHLLEGKELQRANFIVIDPRLTRTAAHATEYVRVRPGTHIPTIYGMLWHIFQNGWEDKEFIKQRVYGMDDVRKEVEKWTPDEVERVTGLPEAQVKRVAEMFAKQKPSTLIWAMGQTQFTVGTANVRASCILLLATGNVGNFGNGANIFRGHCNVQGATDLGLDIVTLPLYYGLVEGAWKHWCRVWEVDYDWMLSRFDSKDDYEVMYLLAKRLGLADRMFKNIKVEGDQPVSEDILREINRGGWSTGYCGQSPERLKLHIANQKDFELVSLRAKDGPAKGDYYGLPWPCWGTPEVKHPGTHTLYNTNLNVRDGGTTFRARFGVEREVKLPDGSTRKDNLLAEGSYSLGSEIKDGYPEFTYGVLKKLGWDNDLTAAEKAVIERIGGNNPDGVSWSIDLSGGIQRVAMAHGCIHYGNGKARANAWNLPDPIPVHREPIYTPRPDLVAKYPTRPDAKEFRVPNTGFTVQKTAVEKGIAKQFPLILTSGRLVEYEGGGEETRSNKWLAELQQDMFIEINPADAAERGIRDGAWVFVWGPEMESGKASRMKALVTERVGKGVTWCPFHFAGWFQSVDQRGKYPQGCDPIVLGESVNTITTYGFDPVTGMQEPKATLCQVRAA